MLKASVRKNKCTGNFPSSTFPVSSLSFSIYAFIMFHDVTHTLEFTSTFGFHSSLPWEEQYLIYTQCDRGTQDIHWVSHPSFLWETMSNHFPLFFQTIHDLHIPVTFPQTSVLLAVPFNSFLCTNSSSVLAVLALSKTFFVWDGTLRRGQLYTDRSSGTRLTQSYFFSLYNSQNPVCHFGHCRTGNEEHPQQLKISYLSANTSAQLGYGQGFQFRLFYIYSCWTELLFRCLLLQILKTFWSFSQPAADVTVLMTSYCQQTITWLLTFFLRLAWTCWIAEKRDLGLGQDTKRGSFIWICNYRLREDLMGRRNEWGF